MPRGMEKYTQVPKISDPIKVDRRSLSSDLKNKDAEEAAPSQNEDQVEQKEEKAKLKDYFEAELSSRAIEDLVDRICDGSFNYRELLNESLIEFGLAKAGHEDARKRRAEILTSFVNRLEDGLAYNQDIFSDEDYQAGQELLNRIFEHAQLMGMDIAALANKAEFARRASVEAKKVMI